MKQLLTSLIVLLGLLCLTTSSFAAESASNTRNCKVEHFIGTGETMELSFSVCEDVLATPTFIKNFSMNCQKGLVTYSMTERPSAKYLRLGNDGSPVHCSST